MCDASGSTFFAYYLTGQVGMEDRCFLGTSAFCDDLQYYYWLNGALNSDYPMGMPTGQVYNVINGAGRVTFMGSNTFHYLQSATYTPAGQVATAVLYYYGNNNSTVTTNTYNNRQQPVNISANSRVATFAFLLHAKVGRRECLLVTAFLSLQH